MKFLTWMTKKYVAGSTREELFRAIRRLHEHGLKATADYLSRPPKNILAAKRAAEQYISLMKAFREHRFDADISVRLSRLGLDIAENIAVENMNRILESAQSNFVWVAAEGERYTERMLKLAKAAHKRFPGRIGVTIAVNFFRAEKDVRDMNRLHIRVRLIKGGHKESDMTAFQKKEDTDRNYEKLMKLLLLDGKEPAFATHDERIIELAKKFAVFHNLYHHQYEFQMRYGVRRDLQKSLSHDAYRVRIYAPYGSHGLGYFLKCIFRV